MAGITLDEIVHIAVIIMAVWGFYKIVMEIVQAITERHDKEQKWDEYEKNLDGRRIGRNDLFAYDGAIRTIGRQPESPRRI